MYILNTESSLKIQSLPNLFLNTIWWYAKKSWFSFILYTPESVQTRQLALLFHLSLLMTQFSRENWTQYKKNLVLLHYLFYLFPRITADFRIFRATSSCSLHSWIMWLGHRLAIKNVTANEHMRHALKQTALVYSKITYKTSLTAQDNA